MHCRDAAGRPIGLATHTPCLRCRKVSYPRVLCWQWRLNLSGGCARQQGGGTHEASLASESVPRASASQAAHRWHCIRLRSTWVFALPRAGDIAVRSRAGTERLRGTVAGWAIDSTNVHVMCHVLQTQMCRPLPRLLSLNSKVSCPRVLLLAMAPQLERGLCQAMGRRNARGIDSSLPEMTHQ